jgi:signal recognition particle subunit SRP54
MFASAGEKLTDFDLFHPDRMASRILDMGDMLTLIEQAEQAFDAEQAERMSSKFASGEDFTLEDFLEQLMAIRRMGPIGNLLGMMPGMGQMKDALAAVDDSQLDRVQAIIRGMTPAELADPKIINASRRLRISKGSATQVSDVNTLVDRFFEARKMMQQMARGGGMPGMPGVPGMPGGGKGRGKQKPQKGKAKRVSGNPAKAAQQKKALEEKAASGNPFGNPDAIDYETAAANLDLPKDFSKFLK